MEHAMKTVHWKIAVIAASLAITSASILSRAQQAAPDLILTNGKIITVDERFTIAQAVAVKGDHFVAVGTNQEISQLAGTGTRRIDLRGRAVVPGLIDNHTHFMRAGETWTEEVRLDGVESRKQAIEMLRAKARMATEGGWIYTLGGWSHHQFTDDKKPFTRGELDQIAPNHPVVLQEAYYRSYLNSRAIQAVGLDKMTDKWIDRDAAGKPTGVIEQDGTRTVAAKIPAPPKEKFESSSLAMIKDWNRAGLTAVGSSGCPTDQFESYRQWARQGQLSMRVFCIIAFGAANAQAVDKVLPQIAQLKLFQGDDYVNTTAYGEQVYGPVNDNMLDVKPDQKPEDWMQLGRILREMAKARLPLHVHATLTASIEGFLDTIEEVNKEYPIRNLRWALIHLDQINASHLERMKKLGMIAAVHARPTILGGVFNEIHGGRSYDMPPLKLVQDSGITWGFGTDTTVVDQFRPFTTLYWAVTGKMVGGSKVLRQTISREDALIAHTRKNAYFHFQENYLGSIQGGKLADLVVLDRDYLTVPADQIKDIKPVMTMVGGKMVFDAASTQTSSR
jgi:predicted amidohydrolase YtcJ